MAKELGWLARRCRLSCWKRGGPRKDRRLFRRHGIELELRHPQPHDAGCFQGNRHVPPHDEKAARCRFASSHRFCRGTGTGGSGEHWKWDDAALSATFLRRCAALTLKRYWRGPACPPTIPCRTGASPNDELEPYYTRAERLLGISGAGLESARRGRVRRGTRHRRSRWATSPALFADAARSLGYHPFSAAGGESEHGLRTPDGVVRPACQYCGFCERFGCMGCAKATAHQHADAGDRAPEEASRCGPG